MKHPIHKVLFLFAFCFYQGAFCGAQINLVPNPSFEIYDTCPFGQNQVSYAVGWHKNCISTPDYFNSCSSSFSVPQNPCGYQYAATGNAYCGIYTYCNLINNYREYIGTELLTPLIIGVKYYIQMKVCSAKNVNCFTNNLGILFSKTPYYYNYIIYPVSINNFSQCNFNLIITDSINWSSLKFTFIADSAYQYLSIGNFFNDSLTQYSTVNCVAAYYYIDDICVSIDSLTCYSSDMTDNANVIDNSVNIYPNPTSDKIIIDISESLQSCNISIYDLLGKKIINALLMPDKNQIEVSNLCPGIYFIEINFDNKTAIKKIVKL